jgi:hypothetical protein
MGMARLFNKNRSIEEWYTRLAVEDGLSFNQIASSEFLGVAFNALGLKHKQSRSKVSICVNNFITKMQDEVRDKLKQDIDQGERFSIVIDEWTSIRNHRFLNVCILTSTTCTNLGLARCHGSMTATRTVQLVKVTYLPYIPIFTVNCLKQLYLIKIFNKV